MEGGLQTGRLKEEIGWEIIGLIQVKDVKGLNRGTGSGDIFEND